MKSLLKLLQPAQHCPEIQDQEQVKKEYAYWRIRIFYSILIGYAFYYFSRKTINFVSPFLLADLHLDKADIGVLVSVMSITYGFSKFISGVAGDRANPRYFMAFGLLITGIVNIFFGFSSSVLAFAILWGLNGAFQGFGWPACARSLTHWYSHNERGRWWAVVNTSHNIGGGLAPLLAVFLAQHYGWRTGMILPGIACVLAAFFLMNRLRDTPQSLGLPRVEDFRNDHVGESTKQGQAEEELTLYDRLFKYVLNNKFIWLLAISYFFVYVLRMAVYDWSILFLTEERGYSSLGAGAIIFWFEVGGFFGNLAAGWISDTVFNGNRNPVNILFSIGMTFATYFYWHFSMGNTFVDSTFIFMIGFLVFGPQMLIGVAAAELSHKKAAGTATGFIGLVAYLGAASAGYPLGKIIDVFGWDGFFIAVIGCGIIASILLLPLWSVTGRESQVAKAGRTAASPSS